MTSIGTIMMSQNPIIGINEWGEGTVDLSGFSLLCGAISSSEVTSLDFAQCGFNSEAIALLGDAITVTRSLTKVVITDNKISESDVATLRAAAPNRCEVVC